MNSAKPNGIARPEDFRNAAEIERQKRAEPVQLPSGLVARLVRLTPFEALLYLGQLPQNIAARIAPGENTPPDSPADLVAISRQVIDTVRFIFVEPRVPDDVKPGTGIPISDIDYSLKWARGEVAGDGRDLDSFRRNTGERAAASGPASADVPDTAERTSAGKLDGLPA
jgi:hypothetical protein